MPRNKQGHSSSESHFIAADDCTKKSVEALVKKDADEKTTVHSGEAKTMSTTMIGETSMQNGEVQNVEMLDALALKCTNNANSKCDKIENRCIGSSESRPNLMQPNSNCIKFSDKVFECEGGELPISSATVSFEHNDANISTPHSTAGSPEQKSMFLNGDADKQSSEHSSQMSGLWPEVSVNSCRSSESHQVVYRLSTTITESKMCSANDTSLSIVTQSSSIKNEQNSCRLPSSVYGPSVSNIEKVLTGLQFTTPVENSLVAGQRDTFQKCNDGIMVNDTVICKPTITEKHATAEDGGNSSKPQIILKETETSAKNNPENCNKNSQSKLKIHIPEISCSESSEPLIPENKKALKFPKITSPQILEQHISKIISENAAIVNTLDPLWSKQYMRQSSLSYSQVSDAESKKVSFANKFRRISEERSSVSISGDSNVSKLQSALLGNLEPKGAVTTHDVVGVSYVPLSSTVTMTTLCSSTYTHPKIITNVTEEELKGSAIKSLLSLKQGRFSNSNTVLKFDKDKCNQHPQNPEGSIIKDLLLKTKSKTKVVAYADNENSVSCFNSLSDYVCTCCGLKFLNQDILEAHNFSCKEPKNNKIVSKVMKDPKTNGSTNPNNEPVDKVQVSLPVLNPMALSNSIGVLLKNEESSCDDTNEDVGPILKKQLLSPFNSQREPTIRKRKISDSALSSTKLSICDEQRGENSCDSKRSIAVGQSLENLTILAHRARSQSIHLFGGEVQVLDGSVAKKIKISTSLPKTSNAKCVLDNTSHVKCSFYDIQDVKSDSAPLPAVVISIAQRVHNSGGTVTHIPTQNSPPSLSALMNLTASSDSTDKGSEISCSAKSWSSAILTKCLSPTTCNNNNVSKLAFEKPVTQNQLNTSTKIALTEMQTCRPFGPFASTNVIKPLTAFSFKPIQENAPSFVPTLTKPIFSNLGGTNVLPFKPASNATADKMQSSTTELGSLGKQECKPEVMPFQYLVSRSIARSIAKSSIPTVLLTPSSPHSPTDDEQEQSDEDTSSSAKSRKRLALSQPHPIRPNTLPLMKKPFTMVGSTLISPETPRPKKACVQLYINGHAYTYLGLKCSTRSTYCCIYRPQPMFVLQDTDPKLSMYSNWQVVPSKEELAGLTPGQMISLYSLKQPIHDSEKLFTMARTGELLSFTHSSYWTYRSKERDKNDTRSSATISHLFPNHGCMSTIDMSGSDNAHPSFPQSTYGSCLTDSFLYNESVTAVKRDGRTSSVSDNTSSLDVEASLSDGDINNSQDEDEDDDDDRADILTDSSQSQAPKRVKIFEGGFKSNEDYTYVRGRGRGKYVCEECGIRCKKPSMLKKHIRTHTDLRPYKCRHCSFAFKTKGNLTKHMKSKAHHKKCTELGIIPVPTSTDDCQIDEEALAKQERLKKRNIRFSDSESPDEDDDDDDDFDDSDGLDEDCESDNSSCIMSMNTNNKLHVSNVQEAESSGSRSIVSGLVDPATSATQEFMLQRTVEQEAARSLLHLSSLNDASKPWPSATGDMLAVATSDLGDTTSASSACQTPVISSCLSPTVSHKGNELSTFLTLPEEHMGHRPRSYSADIPLGGGREQLARQQQAARSAYAVLETAVKEAADNNPRDTNPRRYSISVTREARKARSQTIHWGGGANSSTQLQKWPEMVSAEQPMDLRVSRSVAILPEKNNYGPASADGMTLANPEDTVNVLNTEIYLSDTFTVKPLPLLSSQLLSDYDNVEENSNNGFGAAVALQDVQQSAIPVSAPQPPVFYTTDRRAASITSGRKEGDAMEDLPSPEIQEFSISSPVSPANLDDNCYTVENVVPPALSLTDSSQTIPQSIGEFMKPGSSNMQEGKCVCRICNKIFAKAGQLRIHVNIHYFERPFRCDNCGVSFRTKGHLQKHKRSVSHYNKVNMNMTFGTPSIDNPRPFKCADCKIAFRIHGHLAKHLRSKMHIMKLECLGKLPFGMYAEMERSGVSLNEIDTTDCNNSLESLQVLAQKLYQRDPRRMRWHSPPPSQQTEPEAAASIQRIVETTTTPVSDSLPTTHSSSSAMSVPAPSTVSLNIPHPNSEEVKPESSSMLAFSTTPTSFSETEEIAQTPPPPSTTLFTSQNIAVSSPQPLVRVEGPETETNTALHRSDTCNICGKMFKSTKFLQIHLYCDHSSWNPSAAESTSPPKGATESTGNSSDAVSTQELACDLCGRQFSNRNNLQQHLLSHAQPRPFVCEVCDAGFTSSSSLVAHLATHQQINSSIAASTEANLLHLQ